MLKMAFEYLEIQHCIIDDDGEYWAFTSEGEFEKERARLAADDAVFSTTWTIYGRYRDEAGQLLALAIGDFTQKADAFKVLNAILAPMAKARDDLLTASHNFNTENETDRQTYVSYVEDATDTLSDFINQSSNHERL